HAAGLSPEDPHATGLADEFLQQTAAAGGVSVDPDLRDRLGARYHEVDELLTQTLDHEGYQASEGRSLELVAVINDTPGPEASVRRDIDRSGFGEWLSRAILAGGGHGMRRSPGVGPESAPAIPSCGSPRAAAARTPAGCRR